MKRITTLLLAGLLAMSTLVSCGEDGGSSTTAENSTESSAASSTDGESSETKTVEGVNLEGYPIVDETLTVSLMGAKSAIHGEWKDLIFFQEMEKLTNIAFEFDTPAAEILEEKKNLALNGGTYPEVLFACNISRDQQVKYGSQGILLPLEDLIDEYCPNIQKMFEETPGLRGSVTTPDGHIYALPQQMTLPIALTGTIWVNKEWMDALGIADEDLPTDTEGFKEMLIRFRDEDPNGNGEADEVPFVIYDDANKGDSLYSIMFPWFGLLSAEFYADDDGQIRFGMTEDNAKVAMEYIHDLYAEKLIDNDCFVTGSAEAMAKGAENRVGAGSHALPRFVFGNMSIEKEATYPGMGALSSPVNPERTTTRSSGVTQGTFALTDKCSEETAIAMMRWVDYLYSEEGTIFIHYGPEGIIWEHPDGNEELYRWIPQDDGRNTEEVRGGEITPDCGAGCPKWFKDEYYNMDDVQEQARKYWCETNCWPYAKQPLPEMYFTAEEQAELDVLATDLTKYRQENASKFITGDKSFDEWDSYVAGYESMGIDQMIAIYQQAYDRWAEANNQ